LNGAPVVALLPVELVSMPTQDGRSIFMPAWLKFLTEPAGLTPHGFCLAWDPALIWLHAASDAVIGIAYFSIPVALIWLVRRRSDLNFGWIITLFAVFILGCGTTHWMSILTLWIPAYGAAGVAKALTAIVSAATAVALWPMARQIARLPSRSDMQRANDALRASQGFLRRTGEVARVGGWEVDLIDRSVVWCDTTCHLHDVPAGTTPTLEEAYSYVTPEAQPTLREAVRLGIEQNRPWDVELLMVSAKGRSFWAHIVGSVEREGGRPVRLVGALQEITARKAMEQELAEQKELLQVTLEAIGAAVGDAVISTDMRGRVQWLNSVAETLTGWHRDKAMGEPVASIFVAVGEQSRHAILDPVSACLARLAPDEPCEQVVLLSRNGYEYGIENSAAPIRDLQGRMIGAVLVFRDVSAQRRLAAEMRHRATHDPLTGLANRAEFENSLTQMLGSLAAGGGDTHALMYIDLDQFKLVNDICGHAAGDQLLKQVGALLRSLVRVQDVVARLGGDEFGVILGHCSLEQALHIGQNMCKHMEEFRFLHDGRRFQVGASIGLVPVDRRWPDAGAVLQAADTSCYSAKDAGRNRVHVWFESDHVTALRHRDMDWVTRFGQALDEDLFELHGQLIEPITAAPAGVRFETLLRLRDDTGTLRLPSAFMPAAERFNMATRIDRWVVRHLLAWLEELGHSSEAIAMVSINLSGQSIGDRAFHRDMAEMMRNARCDVRRLCFEITETAAITNFADAAEFIAEMRALGIQIALDDFGAGSSSFGYLKILPVDYLKIDGQFITNLLEDDLDKAAVRCFHDVAQVLGVQTIAECVERADVRDALRREGIDMIQGYLVHRPEPLATLLPRETRVWAISAE
jgi:diguanylate cyclase (GGDEF)-like protein/PAS domain S-box-containing protein